MMACLEGNGCVRLRIVPRLAHTNTNTNPNTHTHKNSMHYGQKGESRMRIKLNGLFIWYTLLLKLHNKVVGECKCR